MEKKSPVILNYAFRPFFLLSGLFAILVMLGWLAALHGSGLPAFTVLWHGHEMLVGFAMAAVAGFSLTAVANWTGRPALHGAILGWLALCWVAGRLAMALSGWIPTRVVISLDMLFPLLLCVLLGREIISVRNRRNYPLIVITAVLAALNGAYHLGAYQLIPGGDRVAVYLLIHTIVLLVTIIAGRIVPNFTANWLRMQGSTQFPKSTDLNDRLTLLLTVLVGLGAGFMPSHPVTGVLAFAAALVHGFRLSRWRGFATTTNPLLFVLHVAYAWLPVAYGLMGCAVFGWLFPPNAALHALTMGAISSMVLAVITRVALGHTGRPLQAARAIVVAYLIMVVAVLLRVAGALMREGYLVTIDLSAAGWMLAFAIFIWVYWPILTRINGSSQDR